MDNDRLPLEKLVAIPREVVLILICPIGHGNRSSCGRDRLGTLGVQNSILAAFRCYIRPSLDSQMEMGIPNSYMILWDDMDVFLITLVTEVMKVQNLLYVLNRFVLSIH